MASTFKQVPWDHIVAAIDGNKGLVDIGPNQREYAPFTFSNGRVMHTKFTKEYVPRFTLSPEAMAETVAAIEALGTVHES